MWQNSYTFQPIVWDHGPPAPLFAEILKDQNLKLNLVLFHFSLELWSPPWDLSIVSFFFILFRLSKLSGDIRKMSCGQAHAPCFEAARVPRGYRARQAGTYAGYQPMTNSKQSKGIFDAFLLWSNNGNECIDLFTFNIFYEKTSRSSSAIVAIR